MLFPSKFSSESRVAEMFIVSAGDFNIVYRDRTELVFETWDQFEAFLDIGDVEGPDCLFRQ
jgi:hypothetical protein